MPIYEYRCRQCRRKTTALVLSRARAAEVRCKSCGGGDLEKLYSRVATPRSEESRLESMADPAAMSGLDENDPASMARWMKRMGKEMGEDFGDDLDQALEEDMAQGEGESDATSDDGGDEL